MEENNKEAENYQNNEKIDFDKLFDEDDIKSWSFYTEEIDDRLAAFVNVCTHPGVDVDCSK